MKIIYKYEILKPKNTLSIKMPSGAKILSVQTQDNIPCISALVETDKPPALRFFKLCATGVPVNFAGDLPYIGTFNIDGAMFFHLFDAGEENGKYH